MWGFSVNEWHDWWRILVLVVCTASLFLLVVKYRKYKFDWNEKTVDLWFSQLMWVLAGIVFALQGIYRDLTFGPSLVFVTAACLTSAKALHSEGPWGGSTG